MRNKEMYWKIVVKQQQNSPTPDSTKTKIENQLSCDEFEFKNKDFGKH